MILLISVFFAIEKHHFCNMAVCLLIHFSRSCFKRVANMKKKKGSNFRTNCGCGLSNVRALYLCFFLRTFAIAIIYRVCWFAPNFLFPFSNGINDGFFFEKLFCSLTQPCFISIYMVRSSSLFCLIIAGVMGFLLYFYSETLLKSIASVNRTINFISIENGPTRINRHFIH